MNNTADNLLNYKNENCSKYKKWKLVEVLNHLNGFKNIYWNLFRSAVIFVIVQAYELSLFYLQILS